jgi:hypothetical protein
VFGRIAWAERRRSAVAATCPDTLHDKSVLKLALERLIRGGVNTQSPSERWNGDCALRQDETNRFGQVH